ncbi:BZ3500_MvSof-1268-A1-R1_Chr8-1g10016 [Microbotryum saponariae]|uniref:BZ3500_MvSof-1268-A1-R1_Chr8-1g10016 protein n=1 Tax=Microbotryum saponariae TaxID=289078 RepID=A0A2X0NJV9_9BASI|nr:BZ3500_MvSof-1268-A1-R1_Chr8-1g10016 [Microbotryum saponariae]SDA08302.1 BZ3501_MvSof-1269-A2-R1_Chr8-1g09739 [Microbotryum saponariae]
MYYEKGLMCCGVNSPGKHILNVQAAIRAPCCRQWFDCAECHAEKEDHDLTKTTEMAFLCKKCKKAFRKDMTKFEESDEYCPHCDNHFVIDAKTPQRIIEFETEDLRVDARGLRDERQRNLHTSDIDAFVDQLG